MAPASLRQLALVTFAVPSLVASGCALSATADGGFAAGNRASVRAGSLAPLPAPPPLRLAEQSSPEPEPPAPAEDDDPFEATIAVTSTTGRIVGSCLGVMVAPRVAITAGHCVNERAKISVAPATVGGSTETVAVQSYWFDPDANPNDGKVDMDSTDVALLVLAKPLPMPSYARYARGPLETATPALGIRHGDGVLESMRFTLQPSRSAARYYVSTGFAKPGDSGSPVFVGRGEGRIVVGVLAGGGPGREVFARVDLMAKKIDELVASTSAAIGKSRSAAPGSPQKRAPAPPSPKTMPRKPASPVRAAPPPANVTWT